MSMSTAAEHKSSYSPHWSATLNVEFSAKSVKTVPSSIKHFGPLRVQRPFYPENDGCCHLYLLHPPGGVAGGDVLEIDISSNDNANSLITTPGATKIYRSNTKSSINQHLRLGSNAVLEWMPQETILFNEAKTEINTRIDLLDSSQLFYWDILCFGMPVNNARFDSGQCRQSLQFWKNDIPLLIEKMDIEGDGDILHSSWGMRNHYVNAIAVMTNNGAEVVKGIRESVNCNNSSLFAVTKKQNIVICRYLGDSVDEAKHYFIQAWEIWRQVELKKHAVSPRIWNT